VVSSCRRGIEAAWKRIHALQEANTRVGLERQQQEAMDAKHQLRRADHAKTVERTERRAMLGAEILERECQALIEGLTAADAQLAGAQRTAEQERAEREREREEQEQEGEGEEEEEVVEEEEERKERMAQDEQAELEECEEQITPDAATIRSSSDGTTGPTTDEELENAVMSILASSGPADAFFILADARCAGADAQKLDRTLQALKDAYLCYETGNGCFAIM
jgi:hypothetical protein